MRSFRVAFEGEAAEALEYLAQRRGSRAQVILDGLSLEKEYLDALRRGARLGILENDGTVSVLVRL
jgi:hypothetical protein